MARTLAPTPWFFATHDGTPLSGGKVYTYEAGTAFTTLADTYSDAGGTLNSNPIILDSDGYASIFMDEGSVQDWAVFDEDDNPIRTQENIGAIPSSSLNSDQPVTFGENVTAGQLAYCSDGSGSLVAGSWYKFDADLPYASAFPQIGFVVADTLAGATGAVRTAGQIELSGLTPGGTYYGSATPGAITATPPAIARIAGQALSSTTLSIQIKPWQNPALNPRGRLTLTTGTPVTTSNVTAATTLYYTPYIGNQLPLYDSTVGRWYSATFSQISIAVPATTAQMYDVFVYNNAGVITLELTAWTNDTTRATALTTQDGVYVKTGVTSRLYLGSFRTTGVSGQTEDSLTKRYLWNYYNRVQRALYVSSATNQHNYTLATWQQFDASATNQVEVVVGVQEVLLYLDYGAAAQNSGGALEGVMVSIGIDSTTVPTTPQRLAADLIPAANAIATLSSTFQQYIAVGRHVAALLQYSQASGTTTWYSNDFAVNGVTFRASITGFIQG